MSAPGRDRGAGAAQRLLETVPDAAVELGEEGLARLDAVAAVSEPFVDGVARHQRIRSALIGPLDARASDEVEADCLRSLHDAAHPASVLAVEQRTGLLRIVARDLLGLADTPAVAAELADLAQGILAAAAALVEQQTGSRLAVIAMGKMGGRELNYVSDVDVLFVGNDDWASSTRGAETFMRLMAEVTPDGRAYEVDANLRPEGRDGALVRSIDAYRSYYERWAKTWEFQALLKARPVAGDAELGAQFTALIEPFVWPDRLDPQAVEEIQRMKAVVEHSKPVLRAGARQVKLAPGGLRDIEFAVQLLQLVHGRHDATLRSANTLEALAALAAGGYVGEEDARDFAGAYVFLRTVEHRLQLANLRRTHTMPQDPDGRRRLARTMADRMPAARDDADRGDVLARFDAELTRVQALVRHLHEKLFYRPLLERFAALSSSEQIPIAGADEESRLAPEAARERLVALGFQRPDAALSHLDALAGGLTRRAQLFRTVLPAILPTLASAPDPDSGLAALRSLADRTRESPYLLRTLRDHPPVADMLARVLGASPVAGRWLERQPELFGLMADLAGLQRRLTGDDYRPLADGMRRRTSGRTEFGAALRRMRRREAARTAVRDLAGLADVVDVATELSGLAEACLQAAIDFVVPDGVTIAVIGLGKLGGSELSYASDLDVLLVAEPGDAQAEAEQAAEDLLELLSAITPEGQTFRVDLNLRPEGKQGPLVRSLTSYRTYYERWGETWELQALTQARFVAGDRALGRAFISSLAELVYPTVMPAQRLADVRRMKARVERERSGDRPRRATTPRAGRPMTPTGRLGGPVRSAAVAAGAKVDVKLGAGGLSDIEWTVQLLQLRSGGRLPDLRRPGALAAISACVAEGLLSDQDGLWLTEGWRLLTRVRNAQYLAGVADTHLLPVAPADMERLARMLGYPRPGAQGLSEDIARTMRRVRKVHERCFYDAHKP